MESTNETVESLFANLVSGEAGSEGEAESKTDEGGNAGASSSAKLLKPEVLRAKFATSLDLKPMTLEQFQLFMGRYHMVVNPVSLTSGDKIADGEVLRKLGQWTVVQMISGEATVVFVLDLAGLRAVPRVLCVGPPVRQLFTCGLNAVA